MKIKWVGVEVLPYDDKEIIRGYGYSEEDKMAVAFTMDIEGREEEVFLEEVVKPIVITKIKEYYDRPQQD